MREAQAFAAGVEETERLRGEELRLERQHPSLQRNGAPLILEKALRGNFGNGAIFLFCKADGVVRKFAAREGPAESRMQAASIGHRPRAAIFDGQSRRQGV